MHVQDRGSETGGWRVGLLWSVSKEWPVHQAESWDFP